MTCEEIASVYSNFSFEGEIVSMGLGENAHGYYFLYLENGSNVIVSPRVENQWRLYRKLKVGDTIKKYSSESIVYVYRGANQVDTLPYFWECP